MIIVGVDPGLSGGIVAMENSTIFLKKVMPIISTPKREYDINKIVDIFKIINKHNIDLVMIEKQQVRPVSGKRACFMTGGGYYLLRGILAALEIPYELTTPQAWMKELQINSKEGKGSIMFCMNKYPKEDFTATERSRKSHDGLTDATCIALYGERRITK